VACLLGAGFAGVAGLASQTACIGHGWVVGAQVVAWVVGNPVVGLLSDVASWRMAQVVPAGIGLLALIAGRLGVLRPGGRSHTSAPGRTCGPR